MNVCVNTSSTDEEDPFEEWRRQTGEASPSAGDVNRTPVAIPPDFRVWENVGKKTINRDG